jgi:hypothetical protein
MLMTLGYYRRAIMMTMKMLTDATETWTPGGTVARKTAVSSDNANDASAGIHMNMKTCEFFECGSLDPFLVSRELSGSGTTLEAWRCGEEEAVVGARWLRDVSAGDRR